MESCSILIRMQFYILHELLKFNDLYYDNYESGENPERSLVFDEVVCVGFPCRRTSCWTYRRGSYYALYVSKKCRRTCQECHVMTHVFSSPSSMSRWSRYSICYERWGTVVLVSMLISFIMPADTGPGDGRKCCLPCYFIVCQ